MGNYVLPMRFYSLDVLRGIASLCVVLSHWPLLILNFDKQSDITSKQLHTNSFLSFFYLYGDYAVFLFFCISGFIFYYLYSESISESKITFKKFSYLRLSRLYPLHFATLVLVVIGQLYYIKTSGSHFAFSFDLYHFFLNLFFVSAWTFDQTLSFNGPVWSVSVEILLYILFFIACRFLPRKFLLYFIFALIGHFVIQKFNNTVGKGVESFFLGVCVFIIYDRIMSKGDVNKTYLWIPIITAVLCTSTVFFIMFIKPNYTFLLPGFIQKTLAHGFVFVLSPLIILSLALYETRKNNFGQKMAFLGNISYSTYLLHFPLMLLTVIIMTELALSPLTYVYSVWLVVVYMLSLILISLFSYHYFEIPAQNYLRSKFKVSRI